MLAFEKRSSCSDASSARASQGRSHRRSGVSKFGLVDILGIRIQVDRILGQKAYCGAIEIKCCEDKPGQHHDYCFIRPRQPRDPAALAYRDRSVAPRTVNNTPPAAQAPELSRKSRTFAPRSVCTHKALAQCRKKTGPRMVVFKL
jgi:hypothetical protein